MQADALEIDAFAQRRLHHERSRNSLAVVRGRAFQSLNTIEQLWQLANHDLLTQLVTMIVRGAPRYHRPVGDVVPYRRLTRNGRIGTDRDVPFETGLSANAHRIADDRGARQSRQARYNAVFADAA